MYVKARFLFRKLLAPILVPLKLWFAVAVVLALKPQQQNITASTSDS